HAGAVIDQVPDPLHAALRGLPGLVPVDDEWFLLTRRVAVVGDVQLPRDQIQLAVAIQIRQRGRMGLGPRTVDHAAGPLAVRALYKQEYTVVMSVRGENILLTIAGDVDDVDEAEL